MNQRGQKRRWITSLWNGGGVFTLTAMLALIPGCPPMMMCESDTDCTTEDRPVCNVASGFCVACNEDAQCDDGMFCNGAETCSDANACVVGDDQCTGANQTCDEPTDSCITTCDDDSDCAAPTPVCDGGECVECGSDADCDDSNACTDDACANGACSNDAVDCDDDDNCTTDSCNGETGDCLNADVVCDEGQTCDPATGTCVDDVACDDDTDCDDGDACNGEETCDPENEAADDQGCVAGTDPCADLDCGEDTPECTENDDGTAACMCPTPITTNFTLNQDNLTGSSGDNLFLAPLEFSTGAGAQRDTLQTGDVANGLGGFDSLTATLTQGGNPVVTLTAIEEILIRNFAAETINAASITGSETWGWMGSTANLTVNTLANKVNASIADIATAGNTFSLVFQAGATTSPTTGTADEITLDVSNTTTGTFNFTTAANGFETLNVNSTGGNDNVLTAITQTTGTSVATINFTGDTDLNVLAGPATALTINAMDMSGGLMLGTGLDAATYAAFSNPANNWAQITGGTGDDVLIFAATLATTDFPTGTIDLGTGTNVVQSTFAGSFSAASKLRNVSEVRFNITADSTYNFSGITGLGTVTIEEDGAAQIFTLSNVPVSSTAGTWPTLNFRGDMTTGANQTFDDVTYTATGNNGGADTLTINVGNRGTFLNTGTATTFSMSLGGTELTIPGIETINIDIADGPVVIPGASFGSLVTLDIDAATSNTGTNVTLGTIRGNTTTPSVLTVDCSGVTGAVNATFDDIANGATITTAGGNDNVTIGTNSVAAHSITVNLGDGANTFVGDTSTGGVDTVTTGSGNDTLTPGPGADTLTTGGGTDTINAGNNDTDENVINTITDFTAGVGGDILVFDATSLEAIDSAVAGDIADITDANNASIAGGEAFTIQRITADGGACTADLCIYDADFAASVNANMAALLADVAAGTITIDCGNDFDADDAFLVGYSDGAGNTRIGLLVSAANDSANTDTVVEGTDLWILNGVNPDNLVDGNFGLWQN